MCRARARGRGCGSGVVRAHLQLVWQASRRRGSIRLSHRACPHLDLLLLPAQRRRPGLLALHLRAFAVLDLGVLHGIDDEEDDAKVDAEEHVREDRANH